MAYALQQGLEQEPYRVAVVHGGWKGLEMARKREYDAIVLDMMLPSLDGYSLAPFAGGRNSDANDDADGPGGNRGYRDRPGFRS